RQHVDPQGKSIEFTISPDGSVNEVKGLDFLFPEQQQAWQQWVARFALAWTLPADGMKFGEKWKSEQAEQAGAPIAGLHWARESSYVRDEPCQASQLSIMGDVSASSAPPDTCAVLLTTATLKQKSSSKDATPEDFKLHELRTMGTAKGTNEIITYISLKSGLVVRATEEAALRSEEHTSELQSRFDLVCRLLLEKKKTPRPTGEPQHRPARLVYMRAAKC